MKLVNNGTFQTIYYQDIVYTRFESNLWGVSWCINHPYTKEIIDDHTELEAMY